MKIYLILLIVLSILEISIAVQKCPPCSWNADMHCGKEPDSGCMVTGLNKCLVELVSCRREEKGMKPFAEIVKGRCPFEPYGRNITKNKCNAQ